MIRLRFKKRKLSELSTEEGEDRADTEEIGEGDQQGVGVADEDSSQTLTEAESDEGECVGLQGLDLLATCASSFLSASDPSSLCPLNLKICQHSRHSSPRNSCSSADRILKRDIRRKLPLMYVNTLINGCDPSLVDGFLRRFAAEELVLYSKIQTPCCTGRPFDEVLLEGRVMVAGFLKGFQILVPDRAMTLTQTIFKSLSSGKADSTPTTRLHCKFQYSGTLLFDLDPTSLALLVKDCHNSRRKEAPEEIDPSTLLKGKMTLRDPAKHMHLEGVLSFHLNQEKRIEKILFLAKHPAHIHAHVQPCPLGELDQEHSHAEVP